MKYLVVLPCVLLQGCWFIMFPLPSLQQSSEGNACVGKYAAYGQRVGPNTNPGENRGKYAIVRKIYGESSRCQDAARPILADVMYED